MGGPVRHAEPGAGHGTMSKRDALGRFGPRGWPLIKNNVRVPRDFDDTRYMEINPDVRTDPRGHYLHFGAHEGRQYK
jgi:hypothetical protein